MSSTLNVTAEPMHRLRARTSEKWTTYPEDVLPMFVAETDYPLAPIVAQAVIKRIEAADTGYVNDPAIAAESFARFADHRWHWQVDPKLVRSTTDVSVAVVEVLRTLLDAGSEVVVTPPVYPPFFGFVPEAGHSVVEVPLLAQNDYRLDLSGIEAAFAAGARAILLCHPHNPVGLSHPLEDLKNLAQIALRFGALVLSDEIHAPLVHPDGEFTPFLAASDAAARVGVCVTSASKGWNIAGLKCGLIVVADPDLDAALDAMSVEVLWRTSIIGLHATAAAFAGGGAWLDATIDAIVDNRRLLSKLLAEYLPNVRYREPSAGYLAWLDLRELGWGDDPAAHILKEGRVALSPGPDFGGEGRGFARLNFACAPDVLTESIQKIAALAPS